MGPITKAAMQLYKKQVTKDFKDNKIPYKNLSYLMDWEKLGKLAIENKLKNIEIASGMGNILENYGKLLKNNYEEKQQIRSSAYEKANKNNPYRYVSPNNLSKLQEELWKAGAFKGVKDRKGKEATFKSAVDGIKGKMTRTAIANAEKMGYTIGENGLLNSPALKETVIKEESKETPINNSKIDGALNTLAKVYNDAKSTIKNTVDFVLNNPGLLLLEDMGRANANRLSNRAFGVRPFSGRTITSLPSLQTEELKKQVRFAKEHGKSGFDADMYKLMYEHDYTSSRGKNGEDRSGLWNRMTTPQGRLEHTLGLYGFYVDENGDTIVHDIYDYNVNLHLGGNTRYAILRNFAGEFASKSTDPNEGKIKYRINLGKL